MGLFKTIKKEILPQSLKAQELDNVLRNLADENERIENLLVEYGIKHFVKKWNKDVVLTGWDLDEGEV